MDESVLQRVEAQRLKLEENISQLKSSLRHWQDLELDYEGLKEEFELLTEDAPSEKCLEVARDFKPLAIKDQELEVLVTQPKKTPQQLADLLTKRIDYVARNVKTLRKELSDAEKKRNALLLAQDPDHRDEAGLPLSEITEELDDSGHVISSTVQEPGKATENLAEVLEKAGVTGFATGRDKRVVSDSAQATAATSSVASKMSEENFDHNDDHEGGEIHRLDSITKPISAPAVNAVTNPHDTEEEANLRQEMLQYQDDLDEVGAIVAELDMAEGDSDVSWDEDEDDLLIGSDVDLDEDGEEHSEDETGMSKHTGISSGYKRRMEDLEKKLGLKDMKNVGPNPDLPQQLQSELARPSAAEAARKAAIARENANKQLPIREKAHGLPAKRVLSREDESQPKPKKKSVAFADSLDIVEEQPVKSVPKSPQPASKPAVNPLHESLIERDISTAPSTPTPPSQQQPKKPSRFKQELRSSQPPYSTPPPTFKEGQLTQPQVFERPSTNSASAPDPSKIDDELHRKEIALDYHKLRNRQIHSQGGYVRDGSDDEDFDDVQNSWGVQDQDGNMRKISRFKAARMGV